MLFSGGVSWSQYDYVSIWIIWSSFWLQYTNLIIKCTFKDLFNTGYNSVYIPMFQRYAFLCGRELLIVVSDRCSVTVFVWKSKQSGGLTLNEIKLVDSYENISLIKRVICVLIQSIFLRCPVPIAHEGKCHQWQLLVNKDRRDKISCTSFSLAGNYKEFIKRIPLFAIQR